VHRGVIRRVDYMSESRVEGVNIMKLMHDSRIGGRGPRHFPKNGRSYSIGQK
jgi:hypothetical protein